MRIHGVNPGEQLPMPAEAFTSPPVGLYSHAGEVWLYRHLWQYSDEALQPPVYYIVAIPFWLAGDAAGGAAGALYAVRLLDAFLFALLAPISFGLCRLLLPSARLAPWLAAGLAAVMPGSLYTGTHVANDGAGTVSGSGLILFAAWRATVGWGWRSSLLAGVLLGLTLLLKPTAGGLAAAIGVAMLIAPTPKLSARLGHQMVATGGSLAVFLPWLIANRILYGSITQLNEPPGLLIRHLVPPVPLDALNQFQQLLAVSFDFWGSGLFALAMVLLTVFALPGITRLALERSGGADRPGLAVCVAGFAGQAAFAWLNPILAGSGEPSPGRYMYPALAAAFVLLIAGWWRYRLPLFAGIGLVAIVALSLVVSLPGRVVIGGGQPVSRFGHPGSAAARVGWHGQGTANGLSIQVDAASYDAKTHALWLHLVAANQSPTESVDWAPTPRLILDGSPVRAGLVTYGFTVDTLAPGDGETGWVRVPVDNGKLDAARSIVVSFPDVADPGYQRLADLLVPLVR
jgi:hypothetical protein